MALEFNFGQQPVQPDNQGNAASLGQQPAAAPQPSGLPFSWQEFMNLSNQVQQANQAMQGGQGQAPWQQQGQMPWQQTMQNSLMQQNPWSNGSDIYDGIVNRGLPFSMSGGTESLYDNKYRDANIVESGIHEIGNWGRFWNNLPGEIAGATGGEQARQDWTFNPEAFDLSNGIQDEDLTQARNFVASLPGMMVGGLFEGVEKGAEAVTGTPFQEYRETPDGLQIADYKLDASQRAAAGVDALINVAGTFTGGAGRVAGGVGKAAMKTAGKALFEEGGEAAARQALSKATKAEIVQEGLDNMSKGVITRAFEGAAGKPLGTAAGIVADIGDEAAEEFVQSYADDVRMKNIDEGSFERALTGAAWGAVGGAVMSGVGRGVSAVTDAVTRSDSAVSVDTDPETFEGDDSGASSLSKLSDNRPGAGMMNPVAKKGLDDIMTQNRYAPASTVVTQTSANSDLDFDKCNLGTANIREMFWNDSVSRKQLASDLNTTEDVLLDIFTKSDDMARDLNALLEKTPRKTVQVVVGRNPDTSNGGFYMDIDHFVNGEAFEAHPLVMPIVGSDWDGDKCSIYLNPNLLDSEEHGKDGLKLEPRGYVTEMLMDPEGESNVAWWWAGITDSTAIDGFKLREVLEETLAPYSGKVNDTNIVDYFQEKIMNSFKEKDKKQRDPALSGAFTELLQTVNEFNKDDSKLKDKYTVNGVELSAQGHGEELPSGRTVLNNVIKRVINDPEVVIRKQYDTMQSSIADSVLDFNGFTDSQKVEYADAIKHWDEAKAEWQLKGTTGGAAKAFQLTKSLHLLAYMIDPDSKYNPIYRQFGELRYLTLSEPVFNNVVEGLADIYGSEPIALNIMRGAFKLADSGTSPMAAIEAICDTLMLAELKHKLGMPGFTINNAASLQEFKDAYIELQGKYSKLYNKAQEGYTSHGYEMLGNSNYRNAISDLSDDVKDAAFQRSFQKVMQDELMEDVFNRSSVRKIGQEGKTIGQFLDEYAKYSYKGDVDAMFLPLRSMPAMGQMEPSAMESFLKSAIYSYGSEQNAIAEAFYNRISNIKINGVLARYDANGGHVDPRDLPSLLDLMDAVHEYVGVREALNNGFVLSDEFIGSQVGRMLLSGDPDMMVNALTSMSIYGQFSGYVDALFGSGGVKIIEDNVREDLQKMSAISPLHELIVDYLMKGNRDVFDYITDLNVSLEAKQREIANVVGNKYRRSNYILNSLQNEVGRFSLSSVSAKMVKSDSALNRFKQRAYDNIRAETESFFEFVDKTPGNKNNLQQGVVNWFNERCRYSVMSYSDDIVAMKVLASLTLDNDKVEKATIEEIMAALHNAGQLGVNGQMLSQLNLVTSATTGVVDKQDWIGNRFHVLSCISDPTYRCWVWDHDLKKRVLMTQDRLFKSVDSQWKPGSRVTYPVIKALLTKYPQIAGYICEPSVNVTASNGSLTAQLARPYNMMEDFKNYQKPYNKIETDGTDPLLVAEVDQAIKCVKSYMFNDPRMHHVVTMMIDPEVLEGQVDVKRLISEVSKATDKLANYVYYRSLKTGLNPNYAESAWFADDRMDLKDSVLDDLGSDVWRLCAAANERLAIDMEVSLDDVVGHELAKSMVHAMIVGEVRAQGFNVSMPDSSSSIGDMAKRVASDQMEAINRTLKIAWYLLSKGNDAMIERFSYMRNTLIDTDSLESQVLEQLKADPGNAGKTDDQLEAEARKVIGAAIDNDTLFNMFKKQGNDWYLSEDDFSDGMRLRRKLNALLGWNPRYTEKRTKDWSNEKVSFIDESVDDCFDELGVLIEERKDDLIKNVNSIIINHELSEISALNSIPINENAMQMAEEAIEGIEGLVMGFASESNKRGSRYSHSMTHDLDSVEEELTRRGVSYKVPPTLHYMSRTAQASVSNQKVSDQAAGNPHKVGTNGGMARKVYPIGYLPKDVLDLKYAYARPVKKKDITELSLAMDYRLINALMPDGTTMRMGSDEFREYFRNEIRDEDDILVLHPDDNPHGLPTGNMETVVYDPRNKYHRLGGILERILGYSQEAMVLKTKKLLKVATAIVNEQPLPRADGGSVATDPNHQNIDADDVIKLFTDFRSAYINALTDEFGPNGSMNDLGFGKTQARILVQALTPGVMVTTRSDKGFETFVLDASLMFGVDANDNTQSFLDGLLVDDTDPNNTVTREVVSAEILSVTPLELSTRIMGKVNEVTDPKGNLSVTDAEEAAVNALSDWSDYSTSIDSNDEYDGIDFIVSSLPPVGYSYATSIPATDNSSPVQLFSDAIWDQAFGGVNRSGTEPAEKHLYNPDDKLHSRPAQIGRELKVKAGDDDGDGFLPVLKIWARRPDSLGSTSAVFENDEQMMLAQNALNAEMYKRGYDYDGSLQSACCICNDIDSIDEALAWSRKNGVMLYVPKDYSRVVEAYCHNAVIKGSDTVISGIEYVAVNPNVINKFFLSRDDMPHGSRGSRDTHKIFFTAIVPSDFELLADAQIRAFKRMWDFTTRNQKSEEYDIDGSLMPVGFSRKRMVTKADAEQLLEKIADRVDDDWMPKDSQAFVENGFILDSDHVKGRVGKQTESFKIRHMIVRYLADIAGNSELDAAGYRPSTPEKNGIAAILMDSRGYMSPILYPKTMPAELNYDNCYIDGNKVVIEFDGETTLLNELTGDSSKFMLAGETFKGMLSKALGKTTPKIAGGRGLDAIASSDTEGSRVGGMDEILFTRLAYYTMKANDMSLFFQKTENSDGSVTYDLKDTVKAWPSEYRDMLLNQRAIGSDLFDQVISGRLTLGTDDEQNRAIRSVFRTCKKHHINPLHLFSNYRLVPVVDKNGVTTGYRRENFVQTMDGDNMHYDEVDWQMALMDVMSNPSTVMSLFNAVDNSLCANGMNDNRDRSEYIISKRGTMLIDFEGNGDYHDWPVRAGFHQALPVNTQQSVPSGQASVSQQHIGMRAFSNGYSDETINGGYPYNNLSVGFYDQPIDFMKERDRRKLARKKESLRYEMPQEVTISSMVNSATHRELKKLKRIRNKVRLTFKNTRPIFNDDNVDILSDPDVYQTSDFASKVNTLNSLADEGSNWNPWMVDALLKCLTGTSWTGDSEHESSGSFRITEKAACKYLDEIISNIREGRLPVYVKDSDSSDSDRFPMPLLPKEVAQWVWNSFEYIRVNNHDSFDEFFQTMRKEQDRAEAKVRSIASNKNRKLAKKQNELIDFARGLRLDWGDTSTILPVFEDYLIDVVKANDRTIGATLATTQKWNSDQQRVFEELCDASDEQISAVRSYLERIGYSKLTVDRGNGNEVSGWSRIDEARSITNFLNNAVELSKVMAVLNPFVTAGNLMDRMFHQTWMRGSINLGRYFRFLPNPYKADKKHYVDVKIRERAVNDPMSLELYKAFREAEFTSDEAAFVSTLVDNGDIQSVIDFVKKKKEQNGIFGKVCDWGYGAASAGSVGLKQQMSTVVDRFVMFAEANGEDFWFEPTDVIGEDGEPLTMLEAMLASPNGFAKFMAYCLGAGSRPTPSFNTFNKAVNSAKVGDIAQKNAVGMVLADICRRMPLAKFFMHTAISRFPAYGLNITGRLANYVLPVSSMNYAFTHILGKTEYGKKLNVEGTQIHTSMREAVLVDLCKLGLGGVAIALYGISGAIQPPDDERKWGNVDEWLVFGMRAGESWWLEDLLGMALPLACFWKACDEGKPRFDIITNGIANACYSNPILRCGDIAAWLMNPAESLVTDYNQDYEEYQKAAGGPPSFSQYLQSNAFSVGMNFLSQFCVPSIAKEWWQASQSREKSHKRVFKKSASGRETQEGEYGATEYTTYDDAMKRRLAKRNPLLAVLFSLSSGESFFPADMPNTVYYDDAQLDANVITSVSGLSGEERMAKVGSIITVLQSYDDMDELARDGFHLDYETMMAVAQQVWDNYHAVDDWYYGLQKSGQLNWYVLGEGDRNKGQRIAGEILKERSNMKTYWYNFYYEKLKNSPIVGSLQAYNRYNTTYATDVNGDVYATGIQRSPFNILPVKLAPGTIDKPEGTSGYSNDFTTPSAVTGLPLSQRALIPIDGKNMEMPDFEALAADGNGNSYSKQHQDVYGTSTISDELTSGNANGTAYPYGTSPYGGGTRRYGSGGGGGGGGSRYSGGGRSYVPNIYAPSINAQTNSSVARVNSNDNFNLPGISAARASSINTRTPDVYAPSPFRVQNMQAPNQMRVSTISPTTIRRPTVNMPDLRMPDVSAPILDMPTDMSVPRAYLSKPGTTRIMNEGRYVNPTSVMMRPEFETKGSREAYKRSDI